MDELFNTNLPEPRKVGVWTEGKAAASLHLEPKELKIPNKSPQSTDDIPTIPDLDDLQDIFEKEISVPPMAEHKDNKETVHILEEVSGGITGSAEGIDATLEVLMSFIPQVETDSADTVWTVDSLLTQLMDSSEPDHNSSL